MREFVKGEKSKRFPNLKVKYLRGQDPIIKLLNEDDEVQETLSISAWDTDTVEEFLKEKLVVM